MKTARVFVFLSALFVLGAGCTPTADIGLSPNRVADAFPEQQKKTEEDDFLSYLKVPHGFAMNVFAEGFKKQRSMVFDPAGTLLTADLEAGTVTALPDLDHDGRADKAILVLEKLDFPNSVAFYKDDLYVSLKDGVYRYTYNPSNFTAVDLIKVMTLPIKAGVQHQTRTVEFGPDGYMYVAIGATCDVCHEDDERYGTILRARPDGSEQEVFARGLRNTVFFTFDSTGRLWGNDMGQDNLDDEAPPDELNIVERGKDYGWPFCYGKNIFNGFGGDASVCRTKKSSFYDYEPHVAPLGIVFIKSPQFPVEWQGDLLIAQHGTWDRQKPNGYKVTHLVVREGKITKEEDFISGWLSFVPGENPADTSHGRPAYLVFDKEGSLFLSDDKNGVIYKITKAP